MTDITQKSLFELIELKTKVAETIGERLTVENELGCTVEYRKETKLYQAHLNQILRGIDIRYDEKFVSESNVGSQFIENIFSRERDKLVTDDDGKTIVDTFKTLIPAFDDCLLKDEDFNITGLHYGTLVAIAGETNAGKSDIVYMIIAGALRQKIKIHLHSYELSYSKLAFNLDSMDKVHKNKLRLNIFDDVEYHGIFSVDILASEAEDLFRLIKIQVELGTKIFILDSGTKVKVNGRLVAMDEMDSILEELKVLAQKNDLIIIVIGQKDKASKIENRNEILGSVLQGHTYDYMFFVNFIDIFDKETTNRKIEMTKARGQDVKRSVITEYDSENNTLIVNKKLNDKKGAKKKRGNSYEEKVSQHTINQTNEKSKTWAGRKSLS